MTSTINASTSSGIVSSADTSGVLALQSNGTTALTVGPGAAISTTNTINTPGVSLGFKNRIINGAMTIDQRNAGASVSGSNVYVVDRMFQQLSGFTCTTQQNAGSVTPPAGFVNYLGITSGAANTISATTSGWLGQRIEGLNCADLGWGAAGASTVTLSFWVRSSLTGTFGGSIVNSDGTRSYPYTYTISSANTWEYKTVTIPGDTSGTWLKTNGIGMQVIFQLGVGSTYTGTAGAWAGTVYTGATGAVNPLATNGATFYITGVQLEVGTAATSFEFRDIGRELFMCQRYFVAMGGTAYERFAFGGWWATSTTSFPVCPLPVPVRSPSAVSVSYNSLSNFTINGPGGNPTSITVDWMGKNNLLSLNVQVSSGATVGQAALLYDNGGGNARLYVSNEL